MENTAVLKTFTLALLLAGSALPAAAQSFTGFVPGNLVVSVEGNGVQGATAGAYTDNQASPLTLFQFSHTGTSSAAYVNSLVLPQTGAGAISSEYGSSSEGTIQLTSDGRSLVIMGYGINAATFNANPTAYGTAINNPAKPTALAQSGSLTGQSYTPVARVVAVIGADGSSDTSTRLFNIFNGNNPRSVASADGSTFYVSGQGSGTDATAGVFYATRGASAATAITGLDTTNKTLSQDTRIVELVGGTLYASVDSKGGSNSARDFIGTLGTPPATGLYDSGNGPTQLTGFGESKTGRLTITALNGNGLASVGAIVNLSPEEYFFANPTTLYVADAGQPKNNSGATSGLGLGGLQKWSFIGGSWKLDYTLTAGLNLVANTGTAGTTGLLGLTGLVNGDSVELYATNYTIGDLDPTFLYGITDSLSALTKPTGETFVQLAAAPVNSNFKGVSFAPQVAAVPEPASWALLIVGFGVVGTASRRRRTALAA